VFPSLSQQVLGNKTWPLVRIARVLFLMPANLVLLQRESLTRAFRWMALIALLSGGAVAAGRLPQQLSLTRQWANWFGEQVDAIWMEQGRLHWQRSAQAPQAVSFRGWRVDFVAEQQPFGAGLGHSREVRGLWLAPEAVYIWWYTPERKFVSQRMLEDGKVMGVFSLNQIFADGPLQKHQFTALAQQWFWRNVPVLLLHQALIVFFQALIYAVIFSALPLLLRSPMLAIGFRRMFTVMLFAAIPPLLIAGVYAGAQVPFLSHRSIFLIAFLFYQYWASRGFQRQAIAAAAAAKRRWPPKL